MIYSIRHLTEYTYEAPVASAVLALRLVPRDNRSQRLLEHRIEIEPPPGLAWRENDFYGNAVDFTRIDETHTALLIKSSVVVEMNPPPPLLIPDADWADVAADTLVDRDFSGLAPAHFLFPSPRVALSESVTGYARQSFPPGRGIVESCRDLVARIKADFRYQPETTTISTPLFDAFTQRRGVCQDFAHIMIGGLRGLGLPAAYVSGYLRTTPPPGKARLQGADATHAWVSVWGGAHIGWINFDPTNGMQTAGEHVILAVGRDFSDVSPVYGVFVGSGDNTLRVEVDVVPLSETVS